VPTSSGSGWRWRLCPCGAGRRDDGQVVRAKPSSRWGAGRVQPMDSSVTRTSSAGDAAGCQDDGVLNREVQSLRFMVVSVRPVVSAARAARGGISIFSARRSTVMCAWSVACLGSASHVDEEGRLGLDAQLLEGDALHVPGVHMVAAPQVVGVAEGVCQAVAAEQHRSSRPSSRKALGESSECPPM